MTLPLRLAFLVLSDDPEDRWTRIERATRRAAALGARWVLTPELAVPGYRFAPSRGTSWIGAPDPALERYRALLAELDLVAFLGTATRSGAALHNAVVAFEGGQVAGQQAKVRVLPGAVEGWSSPGQPQVISAGGAQVGVLICADAWDAGVVAELVRQGAEVLVSAAHWTPGFHGPEGTWEARSAESGLPLLVCNCAGADTVIAWGGQRRLALQPPADAVIAVTLGSGGEISDACICPAALPEVCLSLIAPEAWRAWRDVRLEALREAPEAFSSRLDDWQDAPEARWRERLMGVPLNLVASLGGLPAGQASGTRLDDAGTVELISLWVAPSVRGRGVGGALVQAVVAWARGQGARRVGLGVRATNAPAIALYTHQGFVLSDRRLEDGAELEMILELSG